ncbi:uncharacterized protein HMPREF1541_07748 [Cyphellophora europaea CBS 101466]|uniref:Uncharacterized protein n=1 Tax=Cyphellophora europaea (strain CBS 101466) TaxID=1220924 RepID=W2RQW9_CYPE1|nr:uncharacterized protein HMPREF1541_07748 [Cyphellophora europaea CBS 101466]ETN38124.1 hypothetical protein HMPREF1541_07748 [Cyphellophora europaea CBS 101466]
MAHQSYSQISTTEPGLADSNDPPAPGHPVELRRRSASPAGDTADHDVSRRQTEERPRIRRNSTDTETFSRFKDGLRYSLTPSQHHLLPASTADQRTVRRYSKHDQRRRLWRLSIGEFMLTVTFCVTYFAILYSYSNKDTISVPERRIFNALTTANSLALGVNLAGSLRSYAKMMRWRLLSIRYRPLQTFDLIMGSDSLLNICKLLWRGREKGKLWSKIQGYAVLWFLVNLIATILIGMIGLTYNLDISPSLVLTRNATIKITDLSKVLTDDYQASLSAVNTWGFRGFNLQPIDSYDPDDAFLGNFGSRFNGSTRYYFDDWNEAGTSDLVSWRYVESEARCTAYEVLDGQDGNHTSVTYSQNGRSINQTLEDPPETGGLAFITSTNSTCGARCINILAFQASGPAPSSVDSPDAIEARFFVCNNTISTIHDLELSPGPEYQFPDLQARMLAGAIGWSGDLAQGTHQQLSYLNSSPVAFASTPTAINMSDLISRFAIGAIAAGDGTAPGIGRKLVSHGQAPVDAQILQVKWAYCLPILVGLPVLQFLTLMAVIIWANKAAVRDDSHLAISKVYYSLLSRLAGHGCMLRGEEIAKELQEPEVAYGFVPPDTVGGVGHTDVFVAGSGVLVRRAFEEGMYDGTGYGLERRGDVGRRRPKEKME